MSAADLELVGRQVYGNPLRNDVALQSEGACYPPVSYARYTWVGGPESEKNEVVVGPRSACHNVASATRATRHEEAQAPDNHRSDQARRSLTRLR
jgi:hypothetical protein